MWKPKRSQKGPRAVATVESIFSIVRTRFPLRCSHHVAHWPNHPLRLPKHRIPHSSARTRALTIKVRIYVRTYTLRPSCPGQDYAYEPRYTGHLPCVNGFLLCEFTSTFSDPWHDWSAGMAHRRRPEQGPG